MAQFDSVFISHRSFDYSKAVRLERYLIDNQISSKVILLKNETLCKNYEQLTVHEYFEAIERIKREMELCDFFFFLVCDNYNNGYFTSAELLQWNAMKKNPVIYPIIEEDDVFKYAEPISLSPIDKNQLKRLSYTSYAMTFNPEYGAALESWGKYANDCFLVGCCACGEYYLITKKRMNRYIEIQEVAVCPLCKTSHAKFIQYQKGKKYFSSRFPIVMLPMINEVADLKQLTVDDVIDLLDAKELPKRFALMSMLNDHLQSDFKKNMKSLGKTVGGIAVGIAAICTILNRLDKK